jgi:hypothetical protein
MKLNNNFERISFIILICVFLAVSKCTNQKKIDYRKYPHYPYIIEKVK